MKITKLCIIDPYNNIENKEVNFKDFKDIDYLKPKRQNQVIIAEIVTNH